MRKKTEITIVKSKRAHSVSTTVDSAFDAVEDSVQMVMTVRQDSMAIIEALKTIRFPPPTAVCGERVKALGEARHLISRTRPVLVDLRRNSTNLDDCLDRLESIVAREQAEVDALLAAGAEINEAEDYDED